MHNDPNATQEYSNDSTSATTPLEQPKAYSMAMPQTMPVNTSAPVNTIRLMELSYYTEEALFDYFVANLPVSLHAISRQNSFAQIDFEQYTTIFSRYLVKNGFNPITTQEYLKRSNSFLSVSTSLLEIYNNKTLPQLQNTTLMPPSPIISKPASMPTPGFLGIIFIIWQAWRILGSFSNHFYTKAQYQSLGLELSPIIFFLLIVSCVLCLVGIISLLRRLPSYKIHFTGAFIFSFITALFSNCFAYSMAVPFVTAYQASELASSTLASIFGALIVNVALISYVQLSKKLAAYVKNKP